MITSILRISIQGLPVGFLRVASAKVSPSFASKTVRVIRWLLSLSLNLSFLAHAASPAPGCAGALAGTRYWTSGIAEIYSSQLELIQDRLFYHKSTSFLSGIEYYVSNEWDYTIKSPELKETTDVVVGFGTNSVWDLAIERGAKRIIIADWHPQVLILHELLIRPLILTATSPSEFLSFVSGVPLSEHELGLPLEQVLKKILMSRMEAQVFPKEFYEEILARVGQRFQPRYRNYVGQYLMALLKFREKKGYLTGLEAERFGPLVFSTPTKMGRVDLYRYFHERYSSDFIRANAGSLNEDLRIKASAFSSLPNFRQLQKLFENGVEYALVDVEDQDFYGELFKSIQRDKKVGLSISVTNIFECPYSCEADRKFSTFVARLKERAQSQFIGPIFLHHVTGNLFRHDFHVERLN